MNSRSIELSQYYKYLWWELSSRFEISSKKYNIIEKKNNERIINDNINKIIKFIESFPKEKIERESWKERGNKYLEELISKEDIFILGIINREMKDDFIKCTKEFIKEAKSFDNEISYENIGQAMRNVWIVNMLQQAFGEKIKLTKSVYGYSMLYPYTDNYLDSKAVSIDEKRMFNDRFTKRLKGEKSDNLNCHEEKVYGLVRHIEDEYNREEYNMLYQSLLLIHEGQKTSLNQQAEDTIPYEKDILGISIEKGGASVLVDGNLVRGYMDEAEELFCYGYGFLLQLGDDLQDIKIDKENNHLTIMSQLAGVYKLDKIVNKLINLVDHVVDNAECFVCRDNLELKKLIKSNCIFMILFAIVDNRKYFSKEYIKEIEEYLPFRIGYCSNLKGIIINRFKGLKKEYNGVPLEEVLLEFIE